MSDFKMEKYISTNNQSCRKSNIELLRVVAMLMIIAHHIAIHSQFNFALDSISVNRLWIQLIQMGGKIGVNIFVLISGYFLVTSNSVKTNKVIKLWLQIFTYSAGIFLVLIPFFPQIFGIKAVIKNILPITFSKWWFASAYFVLYLICPFINKLVNSFDKREYRRFLGLLFICWCVIPTFLTASFQSNSLLWFVFLYALAGYIRLHVDINSIKSRGCILASLATMALTFLSVVLFDIIGLKFAFVAEHATYFYNMQSLPVLIISLTLFVGFANIDIGHVPFINTVSSTCFGIYLLHDNNYVRSLLWCNIFKNAHYQESDFLILYTIMQTVIVFIVCAVIEWLRIHLVEKAYLKLIEKISVWVNKRTEKIFSLRIFEKF